MRQVNLRLSEAEFAAMEAASAKAGLTLSAFVRSLSLEGAGVRPFLTADDRLLFNVLLDHLRKVGVNLNQVARSLNSGRVVHPEEVMISLRNVQLVTTGVAVELRTVTKRAGNMRRGDHG
ncbi:plasmid mobilization relaxosome protein MobC [Rhizobium sp. FY34]|uniref:plasmid mobilization protein n=1 Tax=Rhizobium sp. FY34 TaxID=2562309 RepID=UPI001FEE41E5|nr:plasmid mobilization relaxosome protein MobC [Rhizobium sp. FY34]